MSACEGCSDSYCGDCANREALPFLGMLDTSTNLDHVLESFGVKYTFIESGRISVEEKIHELYGDAPPDEMKNAQYKCWCELSWGSGEKDTFDYALIAFGKTPGEAVQQCLKDFVDNVRDGRDGAVAIATHYKFRLPKVSG